MSDSSTSSDVAIVTEGVEVAHFMIKGSQSWFTFTGAMKSGLVYMKNAADFITFVKVAIGVAKSNCSLVWGTLLEML